MNQSLANKNSFHNVEQAQIPVDSGGDQLGFALFLAIMMHVLVIFGIGFTLALSRPPAPTLEVTLAQHSTEQQPQEADYLAQYNQQGSGDQAEKAQITTDRQSPLPAPTAQQVEPIAATPQQRRRAEATALLTTTAASERSAPSAERAEQDSGEAVENLDQATRQELASLQARLDQQRQEYSRMPRINRLTAASTRSADEAAYMHYWVQRIEQTGNNHYPEEARRRGIYGDLRLAVTLLPDGDVESIEILQSSGQAILDQAAIRIVRQAGPFDPFPSELKEWDKFEIIRTWQFIAGNQLKTDS